MVQGRNVGELLANTQKTLFSVEVMPPLKGQRVDALYGAIDPLMQFNPIAVNVTYHREEYAYKKMADGLLKRYSVRKRPGTVGIAAAIRNRYQTEAVPHLICGGFSKEDTENALIDLDFLGIRNVIALRGDSVKNERVFTPEPEGNAYAIDLVQQIMAMNEGHYLHEGIDNDAKTSFSVGVAGYPEKHFESPNMDADLKNLKAKVDAGASYILTQMFFDNRKYFDFVTKCRDVGITCPIVPGIKPLTTERHLSLLPGFFHVDLPDALVQQVVESKTRTEIRKVGIKWAIKQCKELIEFGVPGIHFYTMGKSGSVESIAKEVY